MMLVWAIFRNSLPLQLVTLALIGWGALSANNAFQRSKGAASAVSQINTQSQELANDALAARKPADEPGAVGRLRKSYCGDCASVRAD